MFQSEEILLDSKTHTIATSGTTFSAFADGSIGLLSANTNIAATGIVSISAAPGVVNIHSASMINIGMLTTPTININGLALVDITSKKMVGVGAPKILLAAALGLTEASKFHIVGTKSYRAIAGKINLN